MVNDRPGRRRVDIETAMQDARPERVERDILGEDATALKYAGRDLVPILGDMRQGPALADRLGGGRAQRHSEPEAHVPAAQRDAALVGIETVEDFGARGVGIVNDDPVGAIPVHLPASPIAWASSVAASGVRWAALAALNILPGRHIRSRST